MYLLTDLRTLVISAMTSCVNWRLTLRYIKLHCSRYGCATPRQKTNEAHRPGWHLPSSVNKQAAGHVDGRPPHTAIHQVYPSVGLMSGWRCIGVRVRWYGTPWQCGKSQNNTARETVRGRVVLLFFWHCDSSGDFSDVAMVVAERTRPACITPRPSVRFVCDWK